MATSNKKWGVNNSSTDKVKVVLFVSRRKDNKDLENYEERRMSFITDKEPTDDYIMNKFDHFVEDGIAGELSRMYFSVNARHLPTVRKQLIHFLIDDDEFNLCSIQSKIAGIAAKKECAAEKKWMIDFDSHNKILLRECIDDINNKVNDENSSIEINIHTTPNGHAIVLSHGFDCREFSEKWKDVVTIKKDDMLCVGWERKE